MIWEDYSKILEQKIKYIRVPTVDSETSEPEVLITPKERDQLLKSCKNCRDHALMACFYKSGTRVGGLARHTWKDLVFDEDRAKAVSKTQNRRNGKDLRTHV